MVAALPQGPTHVECPEDEDFLSAFDKMVSDNIQDRMRETVKPQQVDISVPLHIKSSAKKTYGIVQISAHIFVRLLFPHLYHSYKCDYNTDTDLTCSLDLHAL
jgi:hypothetical protein